MYRLALFVILFAFISAFSQNSSSQTGDTVPKKIDSLVIEKEKIDSLKEMYKKDSLSYFKGTSKSKLRGTVLRISRWIKHSKTPHNND